MLNKKTYKLLHSSCITLANILLKYWSLLVIIFTIDITHKNILL